jgi:transposase
MFSMSDADATEATRRRVTIEGVGTLTATCIIAETGGPARFRGAAALASYVVLLPAFISRASGSILAKSPFLLAVTADRLNSDG